MKEQSSHDRTKPADMVMLAGSRDIALPDQGQSEGEQRTLGLEPQILGAAMSLLFRSGFHRRQSLDFARLTILPPLAYGLFTLYGQNQTPYALVTWAWLSEENERVLLENERPLESQDWLSGDRLWVMDLVAPFGGGSWLAADFRNRVAPGPTRAYAIRRRNDGTVGRVACFRRSPSDETTTP